MRPSLSLIRFILFMFTNNFDLDVIDVIWVRMVFRRKESRPFVKFSVHLESDIEKSDQEMFYGYKKRIKGVEVR